MPTVVRCQAGWEPPAQFGWHCGQPVGHNQAAVADRHQAGAKQHGEMSG